MAYPVMIDGRNVLDPDVARSAVRLYMGIRRGVPRAPSRPGRAGYSGSVTDRALSPGRWFIGSHVCRRLVIVRGVGLDDLSEGSLDNLADVRVPLVESDLKYEEVVAGAAAGASRSSTWGKRAVPRSDGVPGRDDRRQRRDTLNVLLAAQRPAPSSSRRRPRPSTGTRTVPPRRGDDAPPPVAVRGQQDGGRGLRLGVLAIARRPRGLAPLLQRLRTRARSRERVRGGRSPVRRGVSLTGNVP